MEILGNKGLLLKLRNPKKVIDVIEGAKSFEDNKVLVDWNLENVQKLTEMGVKVESTINRDYTYTGMFNPFDHQKKTASFLSLRKKAFCFNEQGTGKTASAIWACDYLMNEKQIDRVLIVCPLSIMQSAWQQDIFRTATHRTCDVAYGTPDKRRKILDQGSDFVVINYDGIEIVEDEITNGGFDLIIVDEANAYKNPQTRRWKCLNRILTNAPSMRLWMMTGTPAAQSPVDAFGLAKLVNPDNTPRFLGNWRDQVMLKVSQFTWIPKPQATQKVHNVLQPAIRFTKDQCLDLPPITYQTREVPLTKQQEKYYKDIKRKMYIEAAQEDISAVNAAALMQKLLQISCGAVYSDTRETVLFDAKARLNVIKEIIDETSNKALLFVPFRNAIEMVSEFLHKNKINNEVISGSVTASKRTEIFSRFQNEDNIKVLVIQPQSAAHGVTLTRADTVIWFSPTTSLETYMQANARVHRAGQANKTTVINIEGSAVEKKIYKMLQNKEHVHTKIIDLYKEEIN
jgi:SNF2 family DNA or RNA helicase